MREAIAMVLGFIGAHSEWTFPILFLTAFGESFAVVSLIFPGLAIILAAGLLVPGGTLPLAPVLAGVILGSVAGDAVSWWLGRRYGYVLKRLWPFRSNPALLERAERLFRRHGAASVFIARFMGPLRAIVPLTAGMMHLPARPFWIANIASAVIWAPALILPGSMTALLWKRIDPEMLWLYLTIGGLIGALLIAAAIFILRRLSTPPVPDV